MTEAELLASVVDTCKLLGLRCYHTHDSRRSVAGFPDLVIVGPGGVLFRELKSASRLSRAQSDWITGLARAGADVKVWRTEQWPEPITTELLIASRGLGHMVRTRRLGYGMTLRATAEAAGISAPYLVDIEAGKRTPSPLVLAKLRAALGLPG